MHGLLCIDQIETIQSHSRVAMRALFQKSIKMSEKSISTAFQSNSIKPQIFDYILVLDFEATCDNVIKLEPQVNSIHYYPVY